MFLDNSNDARTDKTNEDDEDVEKEHNTAPMVPMYKKELFAPR